MTIDKIVVVILGFLGIIGTYWFFLMKKEKVVVVGTDSVDILVKGGYVPDVLSISKGKTTTLNFTRTDSNSCLEEVMLPDFKIRKFLPLNKKTPIPITPRKEGTFEIVCGMNMFHGKIIVR